MSTTVGPAYPWGKGGELWAQLISERTAGRIKVKQFPGASAVGGDPSKEFAALRDGSLDLAVGSALAWSAQVKALNVFALPFLVGDATALDTLLRGPVGVTVASAIEAAGVVPLAWGDNDMHGISTAQRVLRKPGDFAGLRVRVTGSALVEETLAALGATPVRASWPDAQKALLGGTLDALETTAQTYHATRAQTLGQKHFIVLALAAEPLVFAVSSAAWNSWSEADRQIVGKAAVEAAARETGLARQASAAAEAAISRELQGAGVTLTRLTSAERAALAAATRPTFDKWSIEIGSDLVGKAQDAITASRKP